MRSSGIHVVSDPADTPAHFEHLASLHNLQQGRVVCELTAGGRNAFWLAQDVLDGLGKREDGLRGGREAWLSLDRAAAWLAGERVKTLFVMRADQRDAGAWRLLVALAAQAGCELWLHTTAPMLSRGHRGVVSEWLATAVSWEEFASLWPPMTQPARPPRGTRARASSHKAASVPRDDFPTFRAACQRLLDGDDFRRVDAEFTAARDLIGSQLQQNPRPARTEALTWVGDVLSEAETLDGRVARLRGCQVTLFHAGYLLSVRLDHLIGALSNDARPSLDHHVASSLREHHDTRAVAAAAITLLADASPTNVAEMRMRDVRADSVAVRVSSRWYTVPAHARGLLNAHRHLRLLDGANDDAPFFAVRSGEGAAVAISAAHLRKELGRLSRASGVLLVSDWTRHADEPAEAWFARRGVALRPLPGAGHRRPPREADMHVNRRRAA